MFIVATLCFLSSVTLRAQNFDNSLTVPPSPQGASFAKYIDYPTDLSSGVPSVSVPIFTLESGTLKLPITLNYHASGLMPSEVSGIIGLGWTLSYGGIISRSIRGYVDETSIMQPIRTAESLSPSVLDDATYLAQSLLGVSSIDNEMDIFYYTLLGKSGKFIFDRNAGVEVFSAKTFPFRPIKVTQSVEGPIQSLFFGYFEIIDDDGTLYRFGKSLKSGLTETEDVLSVYQFPSVRNSGVTSWMLTEIISPNKADTISFEYGKIMAGADNDQIQIVNKVDLETATVTDKPGTPGTYNFMGSYSVNTYSYKKITRIKTRNAEIRFSYTEEFYPNDLLTRIEIFETGAPVPIRTIDLTESKYHSDNTRMNWYKLDRVDFKDQMSGIDQSYRFEYIQNTFPLIDQAEPSPDVVRTKSIDLWGYYNGKSNSTLKPNFVHFPTNNDAIGPLGTADRSSDSNFAKTGVLTKMVFPTGGSVVYEYESNQLYGGIRVNRITYNDYLENSISSRNIVYGPAYGINSFLDRYFRTYSLYRDQFINQWETTTTNCTPTFGTILNGRPVTYGEVTEVIANDTEEFGSIKHHYDARVLEKQLSSIDQSLEPAIIPGGTSFTNHNYDYGAYVQIEYLYADLFENQTQFYDKDHNLQKEVLKYYTNSILDTQHGLYVRRKTSYSEDSYVVVTTKDFDFSQYNVYQFAQILDSIVIKDYMNDESNNTKISTEKFEYNSQLQQTKRTKSQSDGKIATTEVTYPQNYLPTAPYQSMYNRNMINYPVVQTDKVMG